MDNSVAFVDPDYVHKVVSRGTVRGPSKLSGLVAVGPIPLELDAIVFYVRPRAQLVHRLEDKRLEL